MKRILRFLLFIFFNSRFLHQAYVYDCNYEPRLHIEYVFNDKMYTGFADFWFLRWARATWRAAK